MSASIKMNSLRDENKKFQKQLNEVRNLHEKELSKIKDVQRANKKQIKEINDIEITNIKNQHLSKIDKEHQHKDQIINELKNIIDDNKEKNDQHLNQLKTYNQKQLDQEKLQFEDRFQNQTYQNNEKLQKFNRLDQENIKSLHEKSRLEHEKVLKSVQNDIGGMEREYQLKLNNLEHNYQYDLQKAKQDYTTQMSQQKVELRNQINQAKEVGQKDIVKQEKLQNSQLQFQQQEYQRKLQQLKDSYHTQYDSLSREYEGYLTNLQHQTDTVASQVLKEHERKKVLALNKADDPFYQPHVLNPQVREQQDHYVVSLEIPDHEKDRVQLSAKDRNIKISLSRRHNSETTGDNGAVNLSQKYETFTKEFKVADIIDPKKISQTYKDGLMSFKILKA